jgi:hypothetical protein
MGVKFRMQFENVQGDDCVVNILYQDYDGDPITIYGGARPFVLGEFNSDEDIFKPVRPQQATIEILASASGLQIEDFISDNDENIEVRFDYGSWTSYWYGYLSQEDIQEEWIMTNHILVLRADEGFGKLQSVSLSNNAGSNLVGVFTPFALMQYAASKVNGTFLYSRVISNLFHESMTSTGNVTGIDQCYIDARTFEQEINQFEDSYTVLSKLNSSWNMTLFKWNNEWVFLRVPELFRTGNLKGFRTNRPTIGSRAGINERYDINVGVNELVKPIMPTMLKSFIKPSKTSRVNFDWVYHAQIIQNQSFLQGDFIDEVDGGVIRYELKKVSGVESWGAIYGTRKNYTIALWDKINYLSPYTASTAPMGRAEIFENGNLVTNLVYIGGGGTVDQALQPSEFRLEYGDRIKISCKVNTWNYIFSNDQLGCIQVQFEKDPVVGEDTLIKNLANDGGWKDAQVLYVDYGVDEESYKLKDIDVTSEPAEYSGTIRVYLLNFLNFDRGINAQPEQEVHFRDFQIEIIPNGDPRIIKGDYDKYTISANVQNNSTDTIWLDDARTGTHKGAILESDGVTLTGDQWFRLKTFGGNDATAERFTFKRQNALAQWFINRSYKIKIDANFFGLKWESDGSEYPIGLINTIKFVDDAPNKIFWISNLKEIDFMNCTWSASLFEIFDTNVDDNEPTDLDTHSFDFYYE